MIVVVLRLVTDTDARDAVWFMAKSAYDHAIEHSGDNLTGAGEGDDETITVDLGRLPAEGRTSRSTSRLSPRGVTTSRLLQAR